MSEGRKIIMMPGSTYNEHVDQQVFFQGAVHVHNPGGGTKDGTPPQEQYMQPVELITAEQQFPVSPMDGAIFHSSVDMGRLKARIQSLGLAPTERTHWCVVYIVLKENAIIASNATEQEFIRWARDVYGMTSADFRHCLDGAKDKPTTEWRLSIVQQKYIDFARDVREIALAHEFILQKDGCGNPLHLDSHYKWYK